MSNLDAASGLLNHTIDEQKFVLLNNRIESVQAENEVLKNRQEKSEKDTHEFVAYFQRELSRKDEQIGSLTEQISSNKVKYDMDLSGSKLRYESTITNLEQNLRSTEAELTGKLKVAHEDLTRLQTFRDSKDILESKLKELEETLATERKEHDEELSSANRKFLEEKSRLQKETAKRIEKIKQESREEARNGLDADTRRIVTDNKRMGEELRFQLQTTAELQNEKERLEEKNHALKLEVGMHVEKEQEYAKKSQRQSKEIKHLNLKVKNLERSLSQVVQEFEKEKKSTHSRTAQELDDHRLDAEGLRRMLKIKNKELMNIKHLARIVLDQRSEVEQFFLDSLEHVKKEKKVEMDQQRLREKEEFKQKMKKANQGRNIRFPRIVDQTNGINGQTLSNLPRSINEKVDLKDLTWEDRERVLRLLFAKINNVQGQGNGSMNPPPPEVPDGMSFTNSPIPHPPGIE